MIRTDIEDSAESYREYEDGIGDRFVETYDGFKSHVDAELVVAEVALELISA